MQVCIIIGVSDCTVTNIHTTKVIVTQLVKFIERNKFASQNSSFYLVSNIISKKGARGSVAG